MSKKATFLCDLKSGKTIKISLMVMKIIFKDLSKIVCILGDKSGEIKANIPNKKGDIVEEQKQQYLQQSSMILVRFMNYIIMVRLSILLGEKWKDILL